MNSPSKKRKKWIILPIVLVVLGAGAYGAIRLLGQNSQPVNVYPASSFTTTADWFGQSQTEGVVTTDRLQSVYISSTQKITEIYVQEGQTVKAGDPLLSFDTTLSELSLQRQAIKTDQLRLDIQNARDELATINTYRIGVPSSPGSWTAGDEQSYTPVAYLPYGRAADALGTASDPLIYLWNDDCVFSEDFMAAAAASAAENRDVYRQTHPSVPDEPAEPDVPDEPAAPDVPAEPDTPAEPVVPDEPDEPDEPSEPTEPAPETPAPTPAPETPAPTPAEPMPEGIDDPEVYVVFETRESDSLQGGILRSWEMVLLYDSQTGEWAARMIEPDYDPGDAGWADVGGDDFYYDTTVYYTAAEIASMKAECNQRITDLSLQLRQAELEYKRLEYELSSGEVLAKIDGVVKAVRDPDEALAENKPVVLVSGGGGYYVTALLGELELGTLHVGDTVTVQSWESGVQTEGAITEISEYPDQSNSFWYYSDGNQNVSTYPFKVFIDEDANLREGEYVQLSYASSGGSGGGVYLENTFLRRENGESYIYAAGPDETLERRVVRTGQSLWGSYTEIVSGLSPDDYIAFPYGRATKDGARINYAEADELYSSMYY